MESISQYISIAPTITAKSNRNYLLKQLYQLYISQSEINKKENRKRYHEYMRSHHRDLCLKATFSKEKYDSIKPEFKKAKLPAQQKFLTYIKEDRFWYFFSHCDTDGLEKLISESKDILHRYEMANWEDKEKYVVSRHIMGSVKWKNE